MEIYMKRAILYLFGAVFLWFILHVLIITFDGMNDKIGVTDVAVVLGNKVELNGTPSKRLKSRLDRAIELYKENYFNYIIVSGGIGKEGFDEAVVMKDYLIEKGIPDSKIILDQMGYNSYMTAQNTKEIMSRMDLNSVTIISQFYHITRTRLAFRKVGIKDIYTSHARYFELRDLYSLVREYFGFYKYLLR